MKVTQAGNSAAQTGDASNVKPSERAAQAEKIQNAKKARRTEAATENDSVAASISPRAKELARAKSAATSAPDIREQKIAELKKKIAEGKYKVDERAVADRLVDDHISTSGLE